MKELNINLTVAALTLGLAFSIGALAEGLSKESYKLEKDAIKAEYKAAKATCAPMSGNYKDICLVEVEGRKNVRLAELEASYKPTAKNQYEARVAKAEADYALAKEECDVKTGDEMDTCAKAAKAAEMAAKADAKAAMK